MQLDELRAALAARDGTVTIDMALPSPAIQSLLHHYYDGAPLTIAGAAAGLGDGPDQLVIAGSAALFGLPTPVIASFVSDGAGDVAVRIEHDVPAGWTFAGHFQHIPATTDFGLPDGAPRAPLPDLLLSRGALEPPVFALCSHAERDEARQVALLPGWNVLGRFVADKAGGSLAALLPGRELWLAGPLTPAAEPGPPPLPLGDLPAAEPQHPPGILLAGDLGDLTLGHLPLKGAALIVYTPTDAAWAARRDDYPPVMGLRGTLRAGPLALPAEAITPPGADSLLLRADVAGATIAGLGDGATLTGGDDLHTALPDDLLRLVQGLGPLRLEDVTVSLQRADDGSQSVDYVALRLGMHDLSWPVIPRFVELAGLDTTIFVHQPAVAEGRAVGAQITATLDIGPAVLEVRGQLPSASVDAQLAEGTTISLGAVLDKHLPGVLPPRALTITELSLSALPAPVSSYLIQATIEEHLPIPLGHMDLTLDQVGFRLSYTAGSAAGLLIAWVDIAGEPFYASASHPASGAGWVFAGGLEDGRTIGLASLLEALLPAKVALPDALEHVQVEALAITWDTQSGDFSLRGQASVQWDIQLGPRSGPFAAAALDIRSAVDLSTGKRGVTGTLGGELQLDGMRFALSYAFTPGEQILTGVWEAAGEPLGHAALGALFTADLALPPGTELDLSLTRLSFTLDISRQAGDTLVLEGDSARFGDALCTVQRAASGTWDLALVVSMPPGTRTPADLPLVGKELAALDFLDLRSAFALLASGPMLAHMPPGLPATMKVERGLRLGAEIDFGGGGAFDKAMGQMRDLTGQDALIMQVEVGGASGTVLAAALEGSVGIPSREDPRVLLTAPSVFIKPTPLVQFGLSGTIQIRFGGKIIDATGYVTVGEAEATCAFTVSAENGSLLTPLEFRGVHLTEVGVTMGLVWEAAQVELGLEGMFTIGELPAVPRGDRAPLAPGAKPGSNQFICILGLAADVLPNPLLLSLYLDELSLGTAIAALTDHRPDLPAALADIRATELMLSWCDDQIQQPDGSWATPVFGMNTNLDLWGFPAYAGLKIDASSGIHGDAWTAPIHIARVLDITGDNPGGPADSRRASAVEPGGPVIHIDTSGSPYLHGDWEIELFGAGFQKVQVDVTKSGFTFELEYGLGRVFASKLLCALAERTHLHLEFDVTVQFDIHPVTIGAIHLGEIRLGATGFSAALDARVQPPPDLLVELLLAGSLSYDGRTLHLPSVHLKETPASLEHLPELIRAEVKAAEEAIIRPIVDEAERILGETEQAVAELWGTLEADERELADRLKRELEAVEHELGAELERVKREGEAAIGAVEGEAERIAAEARRELDALHADMQAAEAEIRRLADEAAEEAARLAHQVAQAAADAAHAVAQVATEAYHKVKGWVESAAKHTWGFMKHIF